MNLNLLSFNIHKGVGWYPRQSTIHQIHSEISENLFDIILLQEVRGQQFELFAANGWRHSSYGKNAVYQKGHHGNAVLSKYPIIFSENINLSMHRFEKRGLLHCIVELPDFHQLHVLCVHLGLLSRDRCKQLDSIVNHIKKNIPKDDPMILGGDFNDWSGYATKPLMHDLALEEAFLKMRSTYAKTYPSWIPMLKLDRLYFSGCIINDAKRLIKKPWRFLSDHIALSVSLKINK